MRWRYNLERSQATALWLFTVAAFVVAMVAVGGATRLTGSGLSITEWKPLHGVIPPLSAAAWAAEFAKYQQIPQYQFVNRGMSLAEFKPLFWWEWGHRLLGRLVGLVFFVPFVVLLVLRQIPRRLIGRCVVIFALGLMQGVVGWWMVASGLSHRISVAPERLATHLGLAFLILSACVWTGLEAWAGRNRSHHAPAGPALVQGSIGLVVLGFGQVLLGALVAGNQAGRVYTDWPLMNGRVIPADYALKGQGLWSILAHNAAAVQFNHRLMGYLLFASVLAFFVAIARSTAAGGAKRLALWLAGAVTMQALIGVLTVRMAAPLGLALIHQLGAAGLLTLAIATAWRIRRV